MPVWPNWKCTLHQAGKTSARQLPCLSLSLSLSLSLCGMERQSICLTRVHVQTRQEEADFEEGEEAGAGPADDGGEKSAGKFPWSGTDRDYDYEELLGE